ncbi:hypothetical protein [Duganella sp. Root1480D1]|uniref:hypothetical protein n=1 Tax=Duganella sp. Root1480D1 TaxID=1736471 RepID=UPI000708AF93|nr:hypothetical protein [Duganella sp. Root1480D1]KQZ40922.1 hypothetical protein ASD58_26510 [Duganella sp. Root1480D1]
MKSKYLSAAAALLCVAGLAACGGKGNGSIQLGVNVIGIDRTGLVLQNNGGDDLEITGTSNAQYFFKTLMAPDAPFSVTIKTTPDNVSCVLANNTGKINYYTYLQSTVTCTPDPYPLGGTISGLTGSGLVLANGAQTVGVAANGNWQFGSPIGNGSVYGVTVLSQPTNQTCTVTGGTSGNGSGTIKADKTNINVNLTVVVTCK